jgi:hypothetical protein
MSHKDAGAKQTQDDRDRFNHFDAPVLQLLGRSDSPRRFQDRFVSPTKWFRADCALLSSLTALSLSEAAVQDGLDFVQETAGPLFRAIRIEVVTVEAG